MIMTCRRRNLMFSSRYFYGTFQTEKVSVFLKKCLPRPALRNISLSDIKFFFSGLEKLEQINSPSSPVRSLSVHLKQISGLQG